MEQFLPLRDVERVRTIAGYDLFNPALRQLLDEISRRTAAALDMRTAMVSFVLDTTQAVAGSYGLRGVLAYAQGSPVEWAFCAHAVLSGQSTYVVADATADPRHAASPLVTHEGVRAYAGAPVTGADGTLLGMHCVLAECPRQFTEEELAVLVRAAAEISALIAGYRRPVTERAGSVTDLAGSVTGGAGRERVGP